MTLYKQHIFYGIEKGSVEYQNYKKEYNEGTIKKFCKKYNICKTTATSIFGKKERGCGDCLDHYKCKFSEKVIQILDEKEHRTDDMRFRRRSIRPDNIAFNKE